VTLNRKDREVDIVLLSAKDGSIVRNLTSGFDKDSGFDHIVLLGERWNTMPWLAWGPKGDRIAYFVRTEKERSLIIQNVLTRKIEERIPMKSVDEPESPCFSPDGRTITFAALRGAVGDIYTVDLATKAVVNLTTDDFDDFGPTYSLDGKSIVYNARISGNQKLFRLDLATKKKTQLTFGTFDETGAQFIDDHTLVFSSTATDPTVPVEPEVAKNGNIYNIWTLDTNTGELRQYTDALGGNVSAVVLNEAAGNKIAFVTYYKGEYQIHTLERKEPLHTAATADFGAPGPIIDFQAPLQHTLVKANERKKGTFEKMFLEGRPPINVGVTSNGDLFGGSQISFGDVLGDQQFNIFVASISQYRTISASYVNLSRRFQWALQGFSQTQFFYGQQGGYFYDPSLTPIISRDLATATRTVRGGTAFGIYPIDRFHRVEISAGVVQLNEEYNDPALQALATQFQQNTLGQPVFSNGTLVPFGVAFIQETTIFREFGPLAGSTMRIAYDVSPKIGNTLSRQSIDADARYYMRLAASGVLAMRVRGFRSIGDFPDFQYMGGNSEMHGYDYLSFVGQNVAFADAELRFPIIEAAFDAVRRGRRRPRRVLRQHRRRVVRQPGLPLRDQQARHRDADSRLQHGSGDRPRHADSRPADPGQRLPSRRRARIVRHRPSRRSRSAFRFTSTGRGARRSTRRGKISSSRAPAAARRSASRSSPCGSGTTFRRETQRRSPQSHGGTENTFLCASPATSHQPPRAHLATSLLQRTILRDQPNKPHSSRSTAPPSRSGRDLRRSLPIRSRM